MRRMYVVMVCGGWLCAGWGCSDAESANGDRATDSAAMGQGDTFVSTPTDSSADQGAGDGVDTESGDADTVDAVSDPGGADTAIVPSDTEEEDTGADTVDGASDTGGGDTAIVPSDTEEEDTGVDTVDGASDTGDADTTVPIDTGAEDTGTGTEDRATDTGSIPSDHVCANPRPVGFGRNVTGGQGGAVVTASTGTEIHAAICDRAAEDTPLIILVDGTITPGNTTKQQGSCNTADGKIELKEISNISLIGVGTRGVLDQVGIHIRAASNIIIQNLTIKNVRKSNTDTPSNGGDAIGMEADVHDIWIDHNLIHGSTTEGEEHDGLIDMKNHTTDVTISCNHLHTSGRGGLVGSNDSGTDGSTRITWHHNWYQNINSRTHLVREAHGHFFNNYYTQILSSGINCRNGASLLVEGNYFEHARNPLGTFYYVENPGVYQVRDNYFDSSVVWEAASDEIPAGPDVQSTGSVTVPYAYDLDPVASVPAIVQALAGVGVVH